MAQMLQVASSHVIEFAHCSMLTGSPLQLGVYRILPELAEERRKAANGGAQAAQTGTHLVQCFRIAGSHPGVIGYDLTKAIFRNSPKGLPGRHSGVKLKRPRLFKGRPSIFNEFVAALGLRLDCYSKRYNRIQLACQAKQLGPVSVLQLELKFVDRRPASIGINLTVIERNLNLGAIPFKLIKGSFDVHLKQWSQGIANAHAQ